MNKSLKITLVIGSILAFIAVASARAHGYRKGLKGGWNDTEPKLGEGKR